MLAARSKISERFFGLAALASETVFPVIYPSLAVCAAARRSAQTRDGEAKSSSICRMAVSVHGDLCAPPSRRADSPREINEAERPGWMRGRATRNLPRFRTISLSSVVCAAARSRPGAEIQNHSESIRLAVFGHVRVLYIDCSSGFTCELICST